MSDIPLDGTTIPDTPDGVGPEGELTEEDILEAVLQSFVIRLALETAKDTREG